MKREVYFFKDRRAGSGKALLETMRALGMSDSEIKSALIEARKEIENYDGARQLDAAQQAAQPVSTCPNCHKPVDDTQIFCDDCAFLPIEAPEQTAHPVSGQGV